MDENLMNSMTEEINIEEVDLPIEDIESDVLVEETTQDITVETEEDVVIDLSESMGWVSGDDRYHDSLLGVDSPRQHPIEAITNLREELNEIERIKTVYSDKYNIANYYEWADASYDDYGYFVSLVPGTSTIQICRDTDIFGVSVEVAGFVGGQDVSTPRAESYGLIVTSGLVDVRCELDVEVGDCVVSNASGYAKKSDSNYGYRVLARENKKGVEYAVIMLGVQADVTNDIGVYLNEVEQRVSVNETNIISAINLANQAYNKATEIGASNQEMSDKVDNALGVVDKIESGMGDLETQVSNSALISAQAKAIAESAAVSADSMRNEAIDEANKALAETSELRKEFEAKIEEIDTELDNTVLELEATKEDILTIKEELQQSIEDAKEDMNATNDEIKNDIANTKDDLSEARNDILSLKEDLIPLTSWPNGSDNPTGIAGFVAKADEESVILGGLVEWQGETNTSIAAFKQEVANNYATQEMLSEVGDNLALFEQEVSDKYAKQEMVSTVDENLSKYKQEVTDTYATQEMLSSVDDALTSYKQEVSKNYATQQMLSSVEDNITSFKQEVSKTYATQEMVTTVGDNLASFRQEVEDDYATQEMLTNVDDALTSYKQEVEKNYATQQMLSSVEDNFTSYKQEVKDTYATQQMVASVNDNLASYKQEVGDTYATQEMVTKLETDTSKALADYKQEVEDKYATQEMVTKLETDTSKALSDYKQEVTDTYATQISLTTLRTDTTDAIAASEEKATKTYASKNDLTSFESDTNLAMARIEQKADANGAYIQSTVSNMAKYSVGPHSQAYGFTLEQAGSVLEEGMIYVPTVSVTEKYEYTDANKTIQTYTRSFTPQYLYKWGKVSGQYRWITVDKNYTETNETNTSSKAVYFTTTEPSVSGNFGYWYTNGDTITGTTGTYEPYTLYKWESYEYEDGDNEAEATQTEYHWVAVATLAGNSQSRAVSQIRQDANSIELSVTAIDNKYAGTKIWVDDNKSAIQDAVTWTSDNGTSITTFMQEAGDNFASASQVAKIVDKDGNVNAASIVTAVNEAGSSVVIDADHINFEADNYTIHADKINFEGSQFSSQMSQTYSTKDETNKAKQDAIDSANKDTDEKLKNYSTIEQTANSITLSVSQAIDDIEIGGRNLATGTNQGYNGWSVNTNASATRSSATNYGVDCCKITVNSITGMTYFCILYNNIEINKFEPNTQYMVSFDVYANINTTIGAQLQLANGSDSILQSVSSACSITRNQWCKCQYSIKTKSSFTNSSQVLYLWPNNNNINSGTTYIFKNLKIEKGNKATEWTPAPEDMATVSELQVFSDQMVAKVHNKQSGDNCVWEITPSQFNVSAVANNVSGGITVDANGLSVNGIIHAQSGGTIGGWNIANDGLYSSDYTTGIHMGDADAYERESIVTPSGFSYVRFYAGGVVGNTDDAPFMVLEDGSLYANAVKIKGTIEATNGTFNGTIIAEDGNIAGFEFDDSIGLTKTTTTMPDNNSAWSKSEFTIKPGCLLSEHTQYSGYVPAYVNTVEIDNGFLHVQTSNLIYQAFDINSYFMKVTMNGKLYHLFIDPDTNGVYAVPQ